MCKEQQGSQDLKNNVNKRYQNLRVTRAIVRTEAIILNEVGAIGEF